MSEPLTDAEIAELRRLLAEGYAEPWWIEADILCGHDGWIAAMKWRAAKGTASLQAVVALRNTAPRLLDEIEKLRAAAGELSMMGCTMESVVEGNYQLGYRAGLEAAAKLVEESRLGNIPEWEKRRLLAAAIREKGAKP